MVRDLKQPRQLPSPADRHKTPAANCMACRHFYITHHPAFPYGCKGAGFMSRRLPSQEMYNSSGLACLLFQKKDKKP